MLHGKIALARVVGEPGLEVSPRVKGLLSDGSCLRSRDTRRNTIPRTAGSTRATLRRRLHPRPVVLGLPRRHTLPTPIEFPTLYCCA